MSSQPSTPAGDGGDRPHEARLRLDVSKLRAIRPRDYVIRFAFGFVISVIAAVLGETAGLRVGGLFLAFPAILPATLTLMERKDGTAQAASDVRGATFGAVGMCAFAVVVAATVRTSAPAALLGALVAWCLASLLAYLAIRGLVRVAGEKQYLPEIPTTEAAALLTALRLRDLTVTTAESCSGGMVAALLCSVPGASRVFRAGIVAYTDELKVKLLGVPPDVLEEEGAISAEAAAAMATGARERAGADVALAVTGATGSPAEGKSPGLTYIAVATPDGRVRVRRFEDDLGPGRNDERAVRMAIEIATVAVSGLPEARLPGTAAEPAGESPATLRAG